MTTPKIKYWKMQILKSGADKIVVPLTHLFNSALNNIVFPDVLTLPTIVPSFEKNLWRTTDLFGIDSQKMPT